ncbi:SDR family oxidoreductase [Flavobacterium wongokense]|uniref:SDR family oxidoreductase n=1 Tax=Flavobacterium wongokense TaxID=2910674 RepID=UPI001F2300E5|nr:SDR family oxidoreductase [Flavobacterium sp. WG47]MCF6131292.1 SDR family oxidoreductase [Flavobacterium sp. WG47]
MEKPKSFPPQHQSAQHGKETKMFPQPEYIRKNYKGSGKLKGKVALITGGDSGIGRSVAVHFAKEGANIAIVYHSNDEDAQITQKLIEEAGAECLVISGDVKKEKFSRDIVSKTIKKFGKLNILVNNAAVQYPEDDIKQITKENLHQTFETNIFPFFYTTEEALKNFKKGDVIINTASVTAYRGSGHLVDYASTKGAIVSFTQSMAQQLVEKGIRVNGVAPGPIWTPLIPASFDKKEVAQFGKKTPMKRAGQPSEVGPAYVFLACEDSSYITGQMIHINGGEIVGG